MVPMRHVSWLASLIWSVVTAGAAACGRVGFDRDVLQIDGLPLFESRCGQATLLAPITITNTSDTDLAIDAIATGGFVIETALPLTIGAGDTVQLDVRAPAAVIGTDVPGTVKTGTLTMTAGDVVREIPLASTVVGASIAITDEMGGPLSLDFITEGCPTPVSARLVNTGTTTARIMFTTSAVELAGFSSGDVGPSDTVVFTIRPLSGSSCNGAFQVIYTATGDVCDAVPVTLPGTFSINGSSSCSC